MDDGVDTVRAHLARIVDSGRAVLLVCHSGGGMIGSSAMEGMSISSRKQHGMKRGVLKIVFLTAAVFPEGFKHAPLPFYDIQGGAMHCIQPEKLLFADLPPKETSKWMEILQSQPAEGWDSIVTYCGWKDVPSVYLVCEGDQVIPPPMQMGMAEFAGIEIVKCGAGHVCMLSQTERVAEVIKNAVESI